jgi:hypothetical protein
MNYGDDYDSRFAAYVQNHTEQIRFVHYKQAEAHFSREVTSAHDAGFSKGMRTGGLMVSFTWLAVELLRWAL